MYERTETLIERRIVHFEDTTGSGLSGRIESDGRLVVIECSTIEGQSRLRVAPELLAALADLVGAITGDTALVFPPPPEPEPDPTETIES